MRSERKKKHWEQQIERRQGKSHRDVMWSKDGDARKSVI